MSLVVAYTDASFKKEESVAVYGFICFISGKEIYRECNLIEAKIKSSFFAESFAQNKAILWIKENFPGSDFIVFTDSNEDRPRNILHASREHKNIIEVDRMISKKYKELNVVYRASSRNFLSKQNKRNKLKKKWKNRFISNYLIWEPFWEIPQLGQKLERA